MSTELRIEASNGHVILDGLTITPQTRPEQLLACFEVGAEMPVQVGHKTVACQFASTRFAEKHLDIQMQLRFELGALVSIFFTLTDQNRHYSDEEYYNSISEREKLHRSWLKKKMGADPEKCPSHPWGVVGVAQDRSGGVHIYLHNKNNTWASA